MFLKIFIFLAISLSYISGLTSVKVPKYLAIYYGWPSLVQNSQGNLIKASNWFKQFDLVVFGDGIWKTTHGDHNNTVTIISNLIASNKKVFGYVDLGVTTQNLNQTQMQQAVNGWFAMGANGIFWDDAGYDYGVNRTRQATMIQYCHSKNMSVFMNAWNPDDVLGGTNVQLNANDIYLLESYLIADTVYQPFADWKTKADKCANYQATLGVQMACVATPLTCDQFTQAWFGTAMYNFDYFQITDGSYSSSNNNLLFVANPSSSYGTLWQNNTVQSTGGNPPYTRSTNLWTLSINGDGFSWGYGGFTAYGK